MLKKLKGMIYVMRRVFSMLFVAVVMILVVSGGAFALSDAEYKKFMAESAAFRAAEKALASAWKDATDALGGDMFEKLKREQREWVQRGRDEEAGDLIRDGYSRVNAYARSTVDRAKYLNGYISFAETHGGKKGDNNNNDNNSVGLSDAEYRRFMSESEEFRTNERKLEEAFERARRTMSTSEYRRLQADQQAWIQRGRNAAAKEYMDEGYSKVEAYSEATFARIRYLNNKIGSYSEPPHNVPRVRDVTGTYQREGMSAREFVEVRWEDRANGILHVEFCQNAPRTGKVQVSFMNGQLRGNTAIVRDTADDSRSGKLVFNDDGSLVVTMNNAFKRMANNLRNNPSFDGEYGRD